MPRIEMRWGRFTTDLFYGPESGNFPCYDSALAWAKEYVYHAKRQRPGVPVSATHFKGEVGEVLDL